ncbi:MAG TPA: hypothetical protein VF230_15510 [Acidimicrobiales bacterium]
MGEVRLVDLEIIKRYSLAIRQESAPAEDLLAVLDASREVVAAAVAAETGRSSTASKATASKRAARASKTAKTAKPDESATAEDTAS